MGDMDGMSFVPKNLADDASLTSLERLVQHACERIYQERRGRWPSESERLSIAWALISMADVGKRPNDG